ncbi:glycosyl hydrolase family 28-related protein [Actinopolymorpha sp. B17G11]|uniref:right-handed parallel beta-helix repeat-containing protein n=1 Tax=Actinopolymorpha sp. B17G11 TaxID=3160861 RepID=UPI0032E3DE25
MSRRTHSRHTVGDPPDRTTRRGILTGAGVAAGMAAGLGAAGAMAPRPALAAPEQRLRSYYDVRDFGATGDGNADDQPAIQDAIDAASASADGLPQGGGAVVFLPSGLYRVGRTLRIEKSNVGLVGIGAGSVIQGAAAEGHIIYAGTPDPSTPVRNVFFEHFAVTAAVRKVSGAGIFCEHAERYRIDDVKAAPQEVGPGPLHDAFYFRFFDTCVLSNVMAIAHHAGVTLHGKPNQSYGAGFWLIGGSRVIADLEKGSVGVHIGGSSGGIVLEDVDVIVNETNVLIDDALSGTINREIFLNQCFIDSASGHGLDVAAGSVALLHLNNTWVSASGRNVFGTPDPPPSDGFPRGNNINYRSDPDAAAPNRRGLNTVIVDGCRIFNAYGSGIAAGSGKWIITGSNVLYNGLGKNGGHGIALLGDQVSEAIINANIVSDNGSPEGEPSRQLGEGIHIGPGVRNYIVTHNIVRDNATGQIVDRGRGNKIVKDNLTN